MEPTIVVGDALEHLRGMAEHSVDAIVTDPPYGLTANKQGGTGAASVNLETPHGRARIGTGNGPGGFMGMTWDSDVPPVELWAECLRVLKPGGYLLAFAGTRTQHRMATRIEDAGFQIRDMIAWVYGSGFPKSHNGPWGGTALKPAFEPITVARKPLVGTVERNWAEHGTGALNIDGCRVLAAGEQRAAVTGAGGIPARHAVDASCEAGAVSQPHALGRWPANLVHDGSDEVLELFPITESGQPAGVKGGGNNVYGKFAGGIPITGFGDLGSAARFFYCAKATKDERGPGNNHPTVKPIALMRWLCRLVTPAGGLVLDPFAGSGSTGCAAIAEGFRFVGCDLNPEYAAIAESRIRATPQGLAL